MYDIESSEGALQQHIQQQQHQQPARRRGRWAAAVASTLVFGAMVASVAHSGVKEPQQQRQVHRRLAAAAGVAAAAPAATATPVAPAAATPTTATATPVTPATAIPVTPATVTPVTPATATPVTPATAVATVAPTRVGGGRLIDMAVADTMEPAHRQTELGGAKFQTVVKFGTMADFSYLNLVKTYVDQGFNVVVIPEFFVVGETSDSDFTVTLQSVVDGDFDDYLYIFIDEMIKDGNPPLWIRPMHEMNGGWYPWGTQAAGNTPELFIAAFQHVHEVFTAKKANVKFQLAYNCENGELDETPFDAWWPGAAYVDMIVCSGYNRVGTDEGHTVWQSFEEVFQGGYDQMALLPGNKPLGVGETGTLSFEDNDKAQWFTDAFASLDTTFPRVQQVTWLLENKAGEGEGDWDLNSAEQIETFAALLTEYSNQAVVLDLPNYLPLKDVTGDGIINGDDAPLPPLAIDVNNNGKIDVAEQLPVADPSSST